MPDVRRRWALVLSSNPHILGHSHRMEIALSDAQILFDSRRHSVSFESLAAWFTSEGVLTDIEQWTFLTASVPQLAVRTEPSFAIHLSLDSDIVREEALELIDIEGLPPDTAALVAACDSRLEIVSGAQPIISPFSQGGVASFTPSADLSAPTVRDLLARLARTLEGHLSFNE